MILFFALCFVGLAVAGLTALLIFWPLTLVHMRDRHPEALASFGDPAFISPWHCAGCWRGVTAATATVAVRSGHTRLALAAHHFFRPGHGGPARPDFQGNAMTTYEDTLQGAHDSWWLATIGRTLIWARLRVNEAGTAEVLDSDGKTLPYDSEDSARAALFDAEFVALDGLDEEDARIRGFSLHEVSPPQDEDDADLRARMVVNMGGRA